MTTPAHAPTTIRLATLIAAIAAIIMMATACAGTPQSGHPDAPTVAGVPTTAADSTGPSRVAAGPHPSTAVPRSVPVSIAIPAIGVASKLIGLGLQRDGTMQVPAAGFPGGWYTGSPTPGQTGPSIIAGHVDWGGKPGVFYRLRNLTRGDKATVTRRDGSTVTFTVTSVAQYPKNRFPTSTVYGNINHPGLRLITCGGTFNGSAASYNDNIVVYADLTNYRPR